MAQRDDLNFYSGGYISFYRGADVHLSIHFDYDAPIFNMRRIGAHAHLLRIGERATRFEIEFPAVPWADDNSPPAFHTNWRARLARGHIPREMPTRKRSPLMRADIAQCRNAIFSARDNERPPFHFGATELA